MGVNKPSHIDLEALLNESSTTISLNKTLRTIDVGKLVPETYDYISLSYTGDNLTTVVYKDGGSGGTTVATLTLTYSGSKLTSVTKT